jgi:hypothetical protein
VCCRCAATSLRASALVQDLDWSKVSRELDSGRKVDLVLEFNDNGAVLQ